MSKCISAHGEYSEHEGTGEFCDWCGACNHARIIAAAEQRGAIKALRDAATAIEKNQVIIDGDHFQPCNSCMSIHMQFLDHRADQEGDDE